MTSNILKKTVIIQGSRERKMPVDIYFQENQQAKPIIIFSHGFKGFKDWGAFPKMAEFFAKKGFVFVKFNFSYNGGTIENPIDFPDLEAFGRNTYSTELNDLGLIIDYILTSDEVPKTEKNVEKLYLLGHSRGGGITILKGNEDPRVKKIATLAAVGNYANRFPKGENLKRWQAEGVEYVYNSRTKQQMPMYIDAYLDFQQNQSRLDIPRAASRLKIPFLILHGADDETVGIADAELLKERCKLAILKIYPNTNHTFNTKHPWEEANLPAEFEKALEEIVVFFG